MIEFLNAGLERIFNRCEAILTVSFYINKAALWIRVCSVLMMAVGDIHVGLRGSGKRST